jgi:two-component system cell cycle sensor histidine kinase/response regulator CckA
MSSEMRNAGCGEVKLNQTLRLLQVEDSESDAALVVRLLQKAGYDVHAERVEKPEDLRRALNGHGWDIIIADHRMGQFDAPLALQILHETGRNIPFIVVSGSIGEEVAVAMMRSGAHDYVLKDNLNRLVPAVDRELREARARQEHLEAEKKLRDSEERFRRAQLRLRQVVLSSPAVLFTLEIAGKEIRGVSWMSENVLEVFGYAAEATIGATWWMAGTHPDDLAGMRERAATDLLIRGHMEAKFRFRHADGSYRWTRCELRLTHDEAGERTEAVGSWSDITERKLAEEEGARLREQLQQAQKLESIGRLAGGIAHDFNNLLTVINGYSAMLLSSMPPDGLIHEGLAEINLAGERAAALSQQLLVLSRKNVFQPKNVDINEIVAEVEKMLHRVIGEDLRIESDLSPALDSVMADPGQVNQVLMNLAINARDAMPNGGAIRIETSNVEVEGGRRCVQLRVSDTGTGMIPEVLSHVFEPFFTTKKEGEGTGLGLATVYGIVRQCSGSIEVQSQPGKGTSFTIQLPRADSAEADEGPGGAIPISRGDETILVVEDQEQLRKLVGRILRKYGYDVLEAATPAEALARSKGCDGVIHLILTDIVMPEMSGVELAEEVRQLRPSLKVVLMSGYSKRVNADRVRLDFADAYLAKPFSPEALVRKLREVLDRNPKPGIAG